MREIQLKPCPFCGRSATTSITTETFVNHGVMAELINFSVCCLACRIEIHNSIESDDSFEEAEKAIQKAINYWNDRRGNNEID